MKTYSTIALETIDVSNINDRTHVLFRKNVLSIDRPITQYFYGFVLNILFLLILYSFKISYNNLQIPTGHYEKNIWEYSDVMGYVSPGFNFVEYGTFGDKYDPDYYRTIGYPALISFFYYFFGKNWLLALQIFQCITFAFIYPILSATIKIIFPESKKLIRTVFIMLCASGAYFTRSLMVAPDTLFVVMFAASFYFGIKTYSEQHRNFKYLLLYIVFATVAALIRPTLTLLPILNIAIAYWVVKKYKLPFKKIMLKSLYISIAFLFLVNISTIRNYINHSFLSPSSAIGMNAFEVLSQNIFTVVGNTEQYNLYKQKVDEITDISQKTLMRKKIMYQTIRQYPYATIKIICINMIDLFLGNNLLNNTFGYFGYQWKTYNHSASNHLSKRSSFFYYSTYLFIIMYAFFWLLFLLKLVDYFIKKDFKTILIIFILFLMFIAPALLIGGGAGRLRLPFEHILFIYGCSVLWEKIEFKVRIKRNSVAMKPLLRPI